MAQRHVEVSTGLRPAGRQALRESGLNMLSHESFAISDQTLLQGLVTTVLYSKSNIFLEIACSNCDIAKCIEKSYLPKFIVLPKHFLLARRDDFFYSYFLK